MSMGRMLPLCAEYDGYLRDESRQCGAAESIAFPTTEAEVVALVRSLQDGGVPLTVQGARTGLTGGAVPDGGHILNMSRMTAVGPCRYDEASGQHIVTVQPGAVLTEIGAAVEAAGLFFPPDPTETSASIGGMVACNASGALTYHYGPTRRWIQALRVVLADGAVLALRRGERYAWGRAFTLTTAEGADIAGTLPTYHLPKVKNAAGYYVVDDMDLLDLFIGMEGTLGIVTEIELRLLPRPAAIAGLTVFFPSEEGALDFVHAVRAAQSEGADDAPVAIEFFDHAALDLLRRMKSAHAAFQDLPLLKPHYHTAVYTEFHGADADAVEAAMLAVAEQAMALGVSDEDSWYAGTPRDMLAQKRFRHAVPEAVNLCIDERRRETPGLTKLGTDMAVPDAALNAVMRMYRDDLQAAGLESVLFGHIGNNHIHVNILPRSLEEYTRGKALYLSWAERIVALGGSVSAEHGIGKLKTPFLACMYGEEGIAQMRALKARFDPRGLLNRGNLFPV